MGEAPAIGVYRTSMTAAVYISHPSSLEHDTGERPESAARITAIETHLDRLGWLGYERREAPRVDRALLETVHSPAHVARLDAFCSQGGGALDADTVVSSGSWEAALRSAGGAVALVDALLGRTAGTGFAAGRPPGHHATRDAAMGFCLFNNVALAAAHALREYGLERILILDWDVHHGNGTSDLFAASAEVFYVSIHQSPLYPGTGAASDDGTGPGCGFTLNLPVAGGSGDEVFCSLVEQRVVPLIERYEPQLVLISAGYDAHRDDPLARCLMSEAGYGAMTATMRQVCDRLGTPLGGVLEGGYALDALAGSVAATLSALHPSGAPRPATA
jgi:acetoin utilization deacetylase AcuC-like enzyme